MNRGLTLWVPLVCCIAIAGCAQTTQLTPTQYVPNARLFSKARSLASNYRVLYRFGAVPDGEVPEGALIHINGKLYGTTMEGGADGNNGTVFSITTSGTEKVLHSFAGGSSFDSSEPFDSLIDVNGTLYGTTLYGGAYDEGTVFTITTGGKEKVLYSFIPNGSDGLVPYASLIDVNGTLYGTTYQGGADNAGTVFSITTTGAEKVLHAFSGGTDGAYPYAGLIKAKGVLYGTTFEGGTFDEGTVFGITASGFEKVLYSFAGGTSDGANPFGTLIDVKNKLYGTTVSGGANGEGTVFSITRAGTEKVLYNFANGHGAVPYGTLIGVNDTLYGTTYEGGADNKGTIFSITTGGTEKVVHSFAGGSSDGANPVGGLIDVNGTLYGTNTAGGNGYGTVFSRKP